MKTRASQTVRISRRSAIALLSVAPAGLAQVARPGAGGNGASQARQTVLEPLIPFRPAFETIREFSEGFAAVQLNGKFGFINESARMAIEPKFDEVEPFSNGLAAVRLDGKTGWVDRKGDFHTRRPGSGPAQ